MIRYTSFEDINAALVEFEELERRVSTEKAHDSEKPRSRTSSGNLSLNGQSVGNDTEENGELHEDDDGETDSDSGSGTMEHDDEETDQDEVCESEDDSEDGGDPASDDDEVHVRQKVPKVDPEEVADFDRELRALMQARF